MTQIQSYWIIPLSHNILMQMLQSESSPYISTEKCSGNPPYGHLGNMVTSLLQPLFLAQQNSHTFSYKKPSPIRSTVNTANGHILKSKNSRIFYNFALLIRPLAENFEYWTAYDMSIPMFLVSWACICIVLRPIVTYDAFCGAQMPIFTSVLCTEGNFQVVCTITLCVF